MSTENKIGFFNKIIVRLEKFADRPWYLPAMGLLAALDLFVGVIPTDGVLISTVLLRPKRWVLAFIVIATSSALGAVALALAVQNLGEPFVNYLLGDALQTPTWIKVSDFLQEQGVLTLAFISVGPAPQQPAVVLGALAHMPLSKIFIAVWIGRALKYGIFAWAATHAPRFLMRWKFIRKEVGQLEAAHQENIQER